MSKLFIFALMFSSMLLAGGQGSAKKSQAPPPTGQASRMIVQKDATPIVGNEKTVGASPENYIFPAVADDDQIGNAKTVGGSRNYTSPTNDGVGRVGQAKTVGNQ
jgi:hypothetical protein